MYDTIVIGNDLSSLVAAVTSVRHERKTILISDGGVPDIYMTSGYNFNVTPVPLTGLGPDQIFSSFLSEIGISFENDINVHLLNPAIQIFLPNHRIELYNDINEFLIELQREFPCKESANQAFCIDLLRMKSLTDIWMKKNLDAISERRGRYISFIQCFPELLKEGLLFLKILLKIKNNKELQILFKVILQLLLNFREDKNAFFPSLLPYILSLSNRGFYYLRGGKILLMDAIKKTFISYGGEIIEKGSVSGIISCEKIRVSVDGYGDISEVEGKNLIVSTISDAIPLILCDKNMRRLKHRIKKYQTRYYAFTLHMGILNKGIPEKMMPYSAIFIEEKDVCIDNTIFVELSLPEDIGRAPNDKRALSATVLLKDSPCLLSNLELKSTAEIIIRYLKSVLPFLEENLDYLDVDDSIELSKKYHNILNKTYRIKTGAILDTIFFPKRTSLRNIYLVDGISQTGLGHEGDIISGRNAAFSIITKEE